MRVIGGEFRSRRLKSLPGLKLRPTPDRLRETLFDVLAARIQGCTFMDAYAGCGAVGIEALSRGAARAIFIEKHRAAVEVIRENLTVLGLEDRAEVVLGGALALLPCFTAEIVFLDPPYDLEREYESALRLLGRTPPPLVVAQHTARFKLKDEYGKLRRSRFLKQGENALSFYERGHQPRPHPLSSPPLRRDALCYNQSHNPSTRIRRGGLPLCHQRAGAISGKGPL